VEVAESNAYVRNKPVRGWLLGILKNGMNLDMPHIDDSAGPRLVVGSPGKPTMIGMLASDDAMVTSGNSEQESFA
jgi:hypothetical protein